MKLDLTPFLWGGASALLVGLSKTGMPGAGIPAVAMMAEAFRDDTKLSVGAILPVLLIGDLFAITYYRRDADWRRLWQLFPYVVAGMVPGYLVLWLVAGDALRRLIGIIILLLLVLQLGRRRFGWEHLSEQRWFVATTGMLAGFGTTVSNAAGPVMGIYLISQHLDKRQFLGTSAWFFFFVNVSKIPLYTALGMITPASLGFDAWLIPAVVLGALLGIQLMRWIPQRAFNILVLLLAGVAALRMIWF